MSVSEVIGRPGFKAALLGIDFHSQQRHSTFNLLLHSPPSVSSSTPFALAALRTVFKSNPPRTHKNKRRVPVCLTDCLDSGSYHGPRWRMEPGDLFIPVDSIEEEATLTCDAKGSPPPQYRLEHS